MRFCDAMHLSGSTNLPGNSSIFIGKYCFTFDPAQQVSSGKLNVTVWAPSLKPLQSVHLVMFDDEAESFPGPSGQWDALSCTERVRHAKHKVKLDHRKQKAGQLIRFNIKEHLRPRFWYIALADCSGSGLDLISYEVHAQNVPYGWASELSTDKRFAPVFYALFAVAYGVLAAAQGRASAVLASSKKGDNAKDKAAHPFAQILIAGIVLGLASTALSAMHFVRLAADGIGASAIARAVAQLLGGASRFVLAMLLLLVSEGKCISYVMVAADARRLARLLGPFLGACVLLEFWGEYSVSRRYTTDYVYTTPFGWAIIFVDLLLMLLYAAKLWQTHEIERDSTDGTFYRRWGIFYGAWFLALPIITVLSQLALAPYVWYIVSIGVMGTVDIVVYSALVIALWPGNTRTYFKLTSVWDLGLYMPEDLMERCEARRLPIAAVSGGASTSPPSSPPRRLPSLLGHTRRLPNILGGGGRCEKLSAAELP